MPPLPLPRTRAALVACLIGATLALPVIAMAAVVDIATRLIDSRR